MLWWNLCINVSGKILSREGPRKFDKMLSRDARALTKLCLQRQNLVQRFKFPGAKKKREFHQQNM